MNTVAFHTLGCKVNIYDTQSVEEMFVKKGYTKIDFKEIADIYVINTCTVTNESDRKSRQYIRRAIKQNPKAVIVVMGCYAQTKHAEIAEIDGVDLIVGINDKDKIIEYVEEIKHTKEQVKIVGDVFATKDFDHMPIDEFSEHTRAFYKIQEGCNNFCTYCIIPYARGRIRSQEPKTVIENIQKLVNNGYREVVLTGIHTGAYGLDLENYSLTKLLIDIENKVSGIKRLRISSIEINEITDEMLDVIKKSKIIARHLHIPLQSGSDEILKLMKRKYITKEYIEKINFFREQLGSIAITTDVIVGFPSETDEMFKETLDTIKKCNFTDLHIFPYSKRDGTPAANMKNQVPKAIKKIRVNELHMLAENLNFQYIQKYIGQFVSIIVESVDGTYSLGHSSEYLKVKINAILPIKSIVDVKITSIEDDFCFGEVV